MQSDLQTTGSVSNLNIISNIILQVQTTTLFQMQHLQGEVTPCLYRDRNKCYAMSWMQSPDTADNREANDNGTQNNDSRQRGTIVAENEPLAHSQTQSGQKSTLNNRRENIMHKNTV
ncbi:hypothetical protein BaRGS_00029959 [Batillaria attramentaria]|uniref:Uncharacterized protein n=1 Tax=Batillaria attramentaria TaxID=370345 RepID=A0ABD0JV66_9CAEN